MTTVITVTLFIIGIALIVKGGDWFVDASSQIAAASGIPKFIIGATIVSIATTLPEVIVSVIATTEGKVDMAIGNAIGSITANTGLILALSFILAPMVMQRKNFMSKAIMMILAMLSLWVFSLSGTLNVMGIVVLFIILIVFIIENVYSGRNLQEETQNTPLTTSEWIKNIAFFIMGAVAIVFGSQLLVDNGSVLAKMLNIPENVIALTMMAIGTCLPELVTAVSAIIKKQGALSIGNILGANIIDTALILPLCAMTTGTAFPVSMQNITLDMPICIAVNIMALLPSLITQKFQRWQGVIMLATYLTYLFAVVGII